MKKIIIAFDNTSFSKPAIDFAVKLNEISPVLLTGVFLPQAMLATAWSYAETIPAGYFVPGMEAENAAEVQKNIAAFSDICEKNGIDYRVHKDFYDFSIPELITESRFADLILLGSNAFYQNALDKVPNAYIKQVLHEVECPVVLVPGKAVFPLTNIITYDGSEDAVFAIKQFAYLFSNLAKNKTLLVYINNDDDEIPGKINIEELAARHFPDLEIMHLEFNARKYFSAWLSEKPASILVSGAYGRSELSMMFKKSFTDEIIAAQNLPLFIAHK